MDYNHLQFWDLLLGFMLQCTRVAYYLLCYMYQTARVLSLLGSYFYYFYQRKLPCLLFYVDMRILIGKTLKHFYML